MGFQFRGWSDNMWRIFVYMLIAIICIVAFGWYTSTQLGWGWELIKL